MNFELKPVTEAGAKLITLADEHAADFATRAEQHDKDGSFPTENFEAMRESGVLMASLPEEYGGMGVESLHDLGLGIAHLARGDASTAIALNMHFAGVWNTARTSKGSDGAGSKGLLQQVGDQRLITAVTQTESGTDLRHPLTEARPAENGWVLNGRKIFGTISPIADLFFVTVRIKEDGGDIAGTAVVLRGASGIEIRDNWDALGMRGSGSGDIVLQDYALPDAALVRGEPWGTWSPRTIEQEVSGNATLIYAFLGIAETAQELIIDLVKSRRKAPSNRTLAERYSIQRLIAENEIDLAGCRAMLARTSQGLDAFFAEHQSGEADVDEVHDWMKDFQCTKWFVNRKAIEIVDRALTASGGAGYMSKSPLSRLYRDVRAGAFMQPYSPNEAFEYIGKVTLGLEPETEG